MYFFDLSSSSSSFLLSHPPPFFTPSSSPHSSSRLSPSLFRNSFALPRFSILSFVFPAVSLFVFLALWPLSFPLPPPHFIENVWYAGAFYTGTEPPPPLSGLMAGKEQPGRLLVRTFVSRTRGHAEMWPSTCSQGFEARAHARARDHYREGSECNVPMGIIVKVDSSLIRWLYLRYRVHS